MQIYDLPLDEIIPYENNPRKNDRAVDAVAESIKNFGFKVPIIVDSENVIVAGHTRLRAAEKLGLKTVPVIRADDLTEEQVTAYRLADNKTAELAEWDFDKLEAELALIEDIDMSAFGFVFPEDEDEDEDGYDDTYTGKTNIPQYDITGEVPDISDLVDEGKTAELLEEIDNSSLSYTEKEFLRKAAQRHLVFNYKNIAEYYAAASPEMQDLMEKSALVIIDYQDAIMNGFTKLSARIKKLLEADKNAE